MSKRKYLITAMVAITAISVGAAAFAFGKHHNDPVSHANYIVEKVTDELELDDTQIAKLEALKTEMLSVHEQLHKEKADKHAMLMALISTPDFDQGKALEMISHTTETVNNNAPTLVALVGDFYNSLTESQQNELREEIGNHSGSRHHGWRH